jgi:RNA polymerase sigma-54 factor
MLPHLGTEHFSLADYIIGSVNDRGYLTCSVEEAALDCGRTLEEAEMVIELLKECEPPGVGASELRECLLLQLRRPETVEEKLARVIVRDHWDYLVARNTRALSRLFRVTPGLIDAAFSVIAGLNPFPGEGFDTGTKSRSVERSAPVVPDLAIRLEESGWQIVVTGSASHSLRVSRSYETRYTRLKESWSASSDEKRHVKEYVERASRFIDAVEQRNRLVAEIGRYLVEHQGGFVSTGEYRFLRALTRSKMAQELGVHESTISRATNGKFVQIANGEVISFDVFFKPSLRVEKMIEEILQHENPTAPLSDERIAQMLHERGVDVARRTVNKYRDRGKLLSSRRRKSA